MPNTKSVSYSDPKKDRNLPSTYQQVLKNMRDLEDRLLPMAEKLEQTIFNPDWTRPGEGDTKPSDVIMDVDEDTMKVIGVSVVVVNKDTSLKPAEYIRDVTYELKSVEVLGLTGYEGFTLDYCTLMTVRMNSAREIGYPTWQCAFGDVALTPYFRASVNDHVWGKWVRVIDLPRLLESYPTIIQQLSHRQILQSDDQPAPDAQQPGDYWMEVIKPDHGYYFQDLTNSSIMPVTDEEKTNFKFTDVESGEDVEAGENDEYVLGNPGEDYVPPEPVDPPTDPEPETPGESESEEEGSV